MSLLIDGGIIITMEGDTVIPDGTVLVENNTIDFVGKKSTVKRSNGKALHADTVLNADGKYVLPGMINMHCHSFQVFLRTLGADMDLLRWLQNVTWPVVHKYTYKDSLTAALLAVAENIRSGVTCLVDMNYGNPNHEAILEAFHEAQIRGFLARGYYEIESQDHLIEERNTILHTLESLFEEYPNVMAGPMHSCNVTNDLLQRTKELSDRYGRKFYTHIAESEDDIQILVNREGKRDVELLDSLNILDSNFIGVHACNLKQEEIASLGEKKANTVHCATTNMYLADGVSPITELGSAGANVCIGTDGAASTGRLDMFSEMKTAALLQKIYHLDPSKITARDILQMATVNGARALGIRAGMIKEGYLADILILDMFRVNTVVSQDPVSAIVYSADTRNVDTVIVDGKVLLQDKKLTMLDEERVLHTASDASSRLLKRVK